MPGAAAHARPAACFENLFFQEVSVNCSPSSSIADPLQHWCIDRLSSLLEPAPTHVSFRALAGDASSRSYFRAHVAGQKSFIVAYVPPESQSCRSFVDIARTWHTYGIRTPHVHSVDMQRGFMLLEDFGDVQLYSVLSDNNVANFYSSALHLLHTVQGLPLSSMPRLPRYDQTLLRSELELFGHWFVDKMLGIETCEQQATWLASLYDDLIASAVQQPQVPVHRDYHSRNIMVLPEGLGLLDFQDCVLGPIMYDPVSLLKDCYIEWPASDIYKWMQEFADKSPFLAQADSAQIKRWFDLLGAQRHLKVLGIFARLWLRDGNSHYLNDIPRVYRYLSHFFEQYNQWQEVSAWLKTQILPALQQQPWWRE